MAAATRWTRLIRIPIALCWVTRCLGNRHWPGRGPLEAAQTPIRETAPRCSAYPRSLYLLGPTPFPQFRWFCSEPSATCPTWALWHRWHERRCRGRKASKERNCFGFAWGRVCHIGYVALGGMMRCSTYPGSASARRALKTRPAKRGTFGRYLDGGLRRLVGLLPCCCGLAAARFCATNFPPISTRCPLPSHSLHSIPAINPVPRHGSHGMGTFSFIGCLATVAASHNR